MQRANDNPILNPSCDANKPAVPRLRRESRAVKVESRKALQPFHRHRANDFPILNPSCDADKPAVPAGLKFVGGIAFNVLGSMSRLRAVRDRRRTVNSFERNCHERSSPGYS